MAPDVFVIPALLVGLILWMIYDVHKRHQRENDRRKLIGEKKEEQRNREYNAQRWVERNLTTQQRPQIRNSKVIKPVPKPQAPNGRGVGKEVKRVRAVTAPAATPAPTSTPAPSSDTFGDVLIGAAIGAAIEHVFSSPEPAAPAWAGSGGGGDFGGGGASSSWDDSSSSSSSSTDSSSSSSD